MKKIHKILIPVFSVLLVISVIALILSLNGSNGLKLGSVSAELSDGIKGEDFTTLGSASVLTKSPPVKSDFDGIYYRRI